MRTLNRRTFAADCWAEKVRSRGTGERNPRQVSVPVALKAVPWTILALCLPLRPLSLSGVVSQARGQTTGAIPVAVSPRKQGQAEPLSHPRATVCSGVLDDPGRKPGVIPIGSLIQRRTDGCGQTRPGSAPQILWIAPRSAPPVPRQSLQSAAG